MIISRVESRLDENKFIKFASNLYKGDEYWIRPLDKDVVVDVSFEENSLRSANPLLLNLLLS